MLIIVDVDDHDDDYAKPEQAALSGSAQRRPRVGASPIDEQRVAVVAPRGTVFFDGPQVWCHAAAQGATLAPDLPPTAEEHS